MITMIISSTILHVFKHMSLWIVRVYRREIIRSTILHVHVYKHMYLWIVRVYRREIISSTILHVFKHVPLNRRVYRRRFLGSCSRDFHRMWLLSVSVSQALYKTHPLRLMNILVFITMDILICNLLIHQLAFIHII